MKTTALLPLVLLLAACPSSSTDGADEVGDTTDSTESESTETESSESGTATGTETETESTETETTETETETESTETESTETETETTETETGSDECSGTCGAPNCGECPDSGTVAIGNLYAIGATEVSNADYAMFLDVPFATDFLTGWLPPECAWKTDFIPEDWAMGTVEQLPVVGVDWCDAWAYCEWSGQRLCGQVGGGPAELGDVQNAANNEWFRACSGGGNTIYPYGIEYDPLACNGGESGFEELVEVGSLATCEGGFDGIFDMSGNVWEWTSACAVEGEPESQNCRQRGGSYFSDANILRCGINSLRARNFRADSLGIRCCDDL